MPTNKSLQMSEQVSDLIEVGRVSGIYGVHGWLKIFSYTQPRDNILSYSPWLLFSNNDYSPHALLNGRSQGKGIVVRLQGIDDREQVRDLIDTPVFIRKNQLQPARADEYYWHELMGLTVRNIEGVVLGEVTHLVETGANDVMVVRDKKRERLVPFTLGDAVHAVDLEQRVITVDWDPDF